MRFNWLRLVLPPCRLDNCAQERNNQCNNKCDREIATLNEQPFVVKNECWDFVFRGQKWDFLAKHIWVFFFFFANLKDLFLSVFNRLHVACGKIRILFWIHLQWFNKWADSWWLMIPFLRKYCQTQICKKIFITIGC